MEAVVVSLQETEEGKTKGDYRQFKQGFSHTHTHTPLNFPALLQQNKNDKIQPLLPNPSFLRLSKLSGGMLS